MILRYFQNFIIFLLLAACSNMAAATKEKKDEVVILAPFVVTAKSRGIIPLNGLFFSSRLTRRAITPVTITVPIDPSIPLADYGVLKGEQIIAVNGQRLVGLPKSDLIRLWMEAGDSGDIVKLTLQGVGEDSSVFREIQLKRIAPPKHLKPLAK